MNNNNIYMYIYKTTNTVNNKIYIGKKLGKPNFKYFGSGKLIKSAILKYGKENFTIEILEEPTNMIELNNREKFWISELNARDKKIGYNIAEGGEGGQTISSEQLSINAKEIWSREGYREKMIEKRKGRIFEKGMKRTEETKAKMSLKKKGVPQTAEAKEIRKQSNYKRIYQLIKCIETGQEFTRAGTAMEFLNENGYKSISYHITLLKPDTELKIGKFTFRRYPI